MLTTGQQHRRGVRATVGGWAALLIVVAALSVAATTPPASADSTTPPVVSMSVMSATTLNLDGCLPGSAATDLGTVMPGSNAIASAPCVVSFGMNDAMARLVISQSDRGGAFGASPTAMSGTSEWQTSGSAPTGRSWRVRTINGTDLLAVGDAGAISYSNDGGKTWFPVDSPTTSRIMGLATLGPATILIGDDNGDVYRTDDSGMTWSAAAPTGTGKPIEQLLAADDDIVYATSWDGQFSVSTNGGETFTNVTIGGATPVDSLARFDRTPTDPPALLAGVTGGAIKRSTNGGKTWTTSTSPSFTVAEEIITVNDHLALAAVDGGRILRSQDRGATWAAMPTSTTSDLTGVATRDGQFIEATSVDGEIVSSEDAGATWRTKTFGAGALWNIVMLDTNAAVAVGDASLTAYREPDIPIADYDPGTLDWGSPAQSMFGVCLEQLSPSLGVEDWQPDADGNCTDTVTNPPIPDDRWYPVSDSGAVIAGAPYDTTDGSVALRFGMHADAGQIAGRYRADIEFSLYNGAPV